MALPERKSASPAIEAVAGSAAANYPLDVEGEKLVGRQLRKLPGDHFQRSGRIAPPIPFVPRVFDDSLDAFRKHIFDMRHIRIGTVMLPDGAQAAGSRPLSKCWNDYTLLPLSTARRGLGYRKER